MKIKGVIGFVLGILLIGLAVYFIAANGSLTYGLIPLCMGAALVYLGVRPSRTALIVFGHTSIVVGCYLVTLGIYLLPQSEPTLKCVFARPLFWGMFSIFGGICANYHGFCRCVSGNFMQSAKKNEQNDE